MSNLPKAPRVPAGPNSLAAAYNRRTMLGSAMLVPIVTVVGVSDPVPAATASPLATHWEINRRTLHEIDTFPDETDGADEHLWAKVNATETVILESPARSIADVIAKLKVALLHDGADGWVDAELIAGNDEALFARADELDVTGRLIIGAIQSLIAIGEA